MDRIPIPPELVPADAKVEIDAKVFAGYNGGKVFKVTDEDMKAAKGRAFEGISPSATERSTKKAKK